MNSKKKQLQPKDIIKMLMKVNRTGWARLGIWPVETVGDHTFLAVCLAIILCDINSIPHNKIIPVVLYHDAAEVMTGDIPIDVSKLLSNKKKCEIESIEELFKENEYIQLRETLLNYFKNELPYTSFIKSVDIISTLIQALFYERIGWKGLDEFWKNYQYISDDSIKPIYKYLNDYREQLGSSSVKYESSIDDYYENYEYAERHIKLLDNFPKNAYNNLFHDFLLYKDYEINSEKVLDVGAGTGRFSEWFRNNNSSVCSMDINTYLLSNIPKKENSISLKWNINRKWPFYDESQDIVLCGEILEHLFRPDYVLQEAFRVLKVNGYVFISVPDNNHPSRKENLVQYGHPEPPDKRNLFEEHIQIFTPDTVIKGLENIGFKPLAMCWYDLNSGDHSEFINIENSPNIGESLMRHLFIIAKKTLSLASSKDIYINFPSLIEIIKILSRAKYMPSDECSKISIAEKYLNQFSNVSINADNCADKYRSLLIDCLRDCYLSGISKFLKDELSKDFYKLPELYVNFLNISEKVNSVYKKYLYELNL